MSISPPALAPPQTANAVVITLTPNFKLVFLSILAITVLSMIATCYLLFLPSTPSTSSDKTAVIQAFATTWKLGFGAIIGLVGGKTI